MDEFDLKGGGPSAATCPEIMEDAVEVNVGDEAKIDNECHRLPHHLHHANNILVFSPLGG